MGCFCSKEDEYPSIPNRRDAYCYPTITAATTYDRDNTAYNRYRNYQSISNRQDAYCYSTTTATTTTRDNTAYNRQRNQQPKGRADPKPKIGEYKCGACGRFWTSRYCWPNTYQNCKRCKRPVYAHVHRELKPSDNVKDNDDKHPHEMELCQMCQQLGRSCTIKSSTIKSTKHNNKRRH